MDTAQETLHPGLGALTSPSPEFLEQLAAQRVRILFLCTENRARSQMAEGILHHLGQEQVEVYSAGQQPAAAIHPLALQTMAAMGIDISKQHPKHVDEFLDLKFDYMVTVCDRVREVCPIFPGKTKRLHWSIADPAAVTDSEEAQQQAFEQVALELARRIRTLLLLIVQEK